MIDVRCAEAIRLHDEILSLPDETKAVRREKFLELLQYMMVNFQLPKSQGWKLTTCGDKTLPANRDQKLAFKQESIEVRDFYSNSDKIDFRNGLGELTELTFPLAIVVSLMNVHKIQFVEPTLRGIVSEKTDVLSNYSIKVNGENVFPFETFTEIYGKLILGVDAKNYK
jgi:hypothetical protein